MHHHSAGPVAEPQLIRIWVGAATRDWIVDRSGPKARGLSGTEELFVHWARANDSVGIVPNDHVHGVGFVALHHIGTERQRIADVGAWHGENALESHAVVGRIELGQDRFAELRRSGEGTPAKTLDVAGDVD